MEEFASWSYFHFQPDPKTYCPGSLVVVVSPDAGTLYVRSHVVPPKPVEPETAPSESALPLLISVDESWQRMDMNVDFRKAGSASWAGLCEEDSLKIRTDLEGDDRGQSVTKIVSFDPATRQLIVELNVGETRTRSLFLQLSEDGTHLSLLKIERRARSPIAER